MGLATVVSRAFHQAKRPGSLLGPWHAGRDAAAKLVSLISRTGKGIPARHSNDLLHMFCVGLDRGPSVGHRCGVDGSSALGGRFRRACSARFPRQFDRGRADHRRGLPRLPPNVAALGRNTLNHDCYGSVRFWLAPFGAS